VPRPSPKSAPDLARECPDGIAPALRDAIRTALRARHARRLTGATDDDEHSDEDEDNDAAASVAGALDADAMIGAAAAVAVVVVGTARRAHELFVFVRGDGDDLDGPLGVAVDYLDALLRERGGDDDALLPLDWEGRPYEGAADGVVFVRGEIRDYLAEEDAAKLLDEEPPTRAIPGFPA
jgi:hypothetical protein